MTDKELLCRLEEHHRTIRAGLALIQSHCATDCANISGLESARVDLTRASRERSLFVSEHVIPRLLETADCDDRAALSDFLVAFTSKRLISDRHIERWTDESIAADVPGYCEAARTIWAMMEEQMERETRVLGSRLQRNSALCGARV
jgi:hypothetical protein